MALSLLRQCLSQKPPGRWCPGAHAGLDPAISKIITGGDEVDGGVTGVHSWSTEQPGRNGCWDLLQKVFAFSRCRFILERLSGPAAYVTFMPRLA